MTLLIVGGESDPNTQRVVDQAHLRELQYFFWDTDDPACCNIAWDFKSPVLDLGNDRIVPTSIFLRCNVFAGDPLVNQNAFEMIKSYAYAWPQTRMLNRRTIGSFNNKSLNLRLAAKYGFDVPETLVMSNLYPLTTIPDAESKIAKPLNGGAHTRSVGELRDDEDALLNSPPMFIQENIAGENLRIFSVNGRLSCYHLVTSMLDYREDDQVDVVEIEVPQPLIEPTKRLVSEKQFDYSALDFRCRSGFEDPVFLEINSFPMFVRFDNVGNHCIVDAILDFLIEDK